MVRKKLDFSLFQLEYKWVLPLLPKPLLPKAFFAQATIARAYIAQVGFCPSDHIAQVVSLPK